MRKSTRIVASIGCLLAAVGGVFPPLEGVITWWEDGQRIGVYSVGRGFILANNPVGTSPLRWDDSKEVRVQRQFNFRRLMAEWAVMAFAAAGVILLLGLRREQVPPPVVS